MFIVSTQVLENYGAHAESGKFADGQNYWKFKGGDTYLVEDLDREQDAMAFVAALVMENGIGFKEYPCHIQTVTEWASELPNDAGEVQSCRDYYLSQVIRVSPTAPKDVSKRGIKEEEVA
jgi:hypothetical protein|tara:strand:+ start:63 stop:422 length:360 start_codon:yes stop_codon:yes gene_type:complete